MKKIFLILFLLIGVMSFSDEESQLSEENVISLSVEEGGDAYSDFSVSDTEGLVSKMIQNMVSPVTGDLILYEMDMVLEGPEPIYLDRLYNSSNETNCHYLGKGWSFLPLCEYHQDIDKGYFKTQSGTQLCFENKARRKKDKAQYKLAKPKGFTNCNGKISAQTNLKNLELIPLKGERYFNKATIKDGANRIINLESNYAPSKQDFLTKEIINPNQTCIGFKHSIHAPYAIFATDASKKLTYSHIQFFLADAKLLKKKKLNLPLTEDVLYLAESSNELMTSYSLKQAVDYLHPENSEFFLWNVSSSEKAEQKYRYNNEKKIAKVQKGNRFLEVDYYKPGLNLVSVTPIYVAEKDIRDGKVSCLKAPVGHDLTPIPICHIFYDQDITYAFDAYNRKTTYHFLEKDQRVRQVVRYVGKENHQLYSTEEYHWGSKYTPDEGNILAKCWKNSEGIIQKGVFFTYDERGNILDERIYGNISGQCPIPVAIENKRVIPNGCESFGKKCAYSGDGYNLLLTEQDDNGKLVSYYYLPKSNIVSAKLTFDPNGTIVQREYFFYDDNYLLKRKIVDDGCFEDPHNLTQCTYRKITDISPLMVYPVGKPAVQIDKYFDFKENVEKQLKRTVNTYNNRGYLTTQEVYDANDAHCYTLSWEYDSHGNVTKEVNALGQVIIRTFDINDNKTFEQGPRHDFYTAYTYDFMDRLVQTKEVHGNGFVFTNSYRYDYIGNLISSVDSFGNETTYKYDDLDRLSEKVSPPINNGLNQIVYPKECYHYDMFGNPVAIVNSKGLTSYISYNIHNKPVAKVNFDQTYERFVYNLDGTLFQSFDPKGIYTQYKRDCFGRVLLEQTFGPDGALLNQKEYKYKGANLIFEKSNEMEVHYTYDGAQRLIAKLENDRLTTFAYDALSRLTHTYNWLSPLTAQVQVKVYNQGDQIVEERVEDLNGTIFVHKKYQYDFGGNQSVIQTGDYFQTILYDSKNVPIQITDGEQNTTYTTYELTHVPEVPFRYITTDPKGNKKVEYKDFLGHTRSVECYDLMGSITSKHDYCFDQLGNLTTTLDHFIVNGTTVQILKNTREYNERNELIKLTEGAESPEQRSVYYKYNQLGQLATVLKSNGKEIHHTYDFKGRLQSKSSVDEFCYEFTYDANDRIVSILDKVQNKLTTRLYDHLGRTTQETLQNGLTLSYAYDNLNRITKVTLPDGSFLDKTYDACYLRQVQRNGLSHTYDTYNQSGRLLSMTHALDSGSTTFAYNQNAQPKEMKHNKFSQNLSFDTLGNILEKAGHDEIGNYACNYTYNSLSQLTSEKGMADNTYAYDSMHNRIVQNGETCQFNQFSQIISNQETTFSYDLNGNLTKKVAPNKEITYEYDALDRLVKATVDGTVTTYTYDYFNRRMSKNDQLFFYEVDNEIGSYQNGAIQELRVLGCGRGAEIGASILMELKGKTYLPLHDLNGNIVALLNENGEVEESYRYDAYGNELEKIASINPWHYSSKRIDPETGFIYFGARYYDPSLGRWITKDPLGYADGPNLYAYVHSRPVGSVDLHGLYDYVDTEEFMNRSRNLDRVSLPEVTIYGGEELSVERLNEISSNVEFLDKFEYELSHSTNFSGLFKYTGTNGDLPEGRIKVHINGIDTSFSDAYERAKKSSEDNGGYSMYFVYNATHGFFTDLRECGHNLMGYGTNPGWILNRFLTNEIKNNPDVDILVECHSQGAIHTKNAIESMPKGTFTKNVQVLGIAPAAYIDPKYCKDVIYYRAYFYRDPIPYISLFSAIKAKKVVTLRSHAQASWHDHSYDSLTYKDVIKNHTTKFIQTGSI
ncbi:Cell wall-associated polypeptide CWBP200 [Candidatus Rubidus massiliensis]|nr:Cell wall-associated polypeptide CWBP200 [Candidatus Rubidus massiliensis]